MTSHRYSEIKDMDDFGILYYDLEQLVTCTNSSPKGPPGAIVNTDDPVSYHSN